MALSNGVSTGKPFISARSRSSIARNRIHSDTVVVLAIHHQKSRFLTLPSLCISSLSLYYGEAF